MSENQNEKKNKHQLQSEENYKKIQDYYYDYVMVHNKVPVKIKMAEELGITRVTLDKYLKKIQMKDNIEQFKIYTPLVLKNLTEKALSPTADSSTFKLYLQVIENWTPTQKIQTENLNKTLKITVGGRSFDDAMNEAKLLLNKSEKKSVEKTDYEIIEDDGTNSD